VLDGRDIGTVIAPDADAKLFVTASRRSARERRVRELLARGMPAHYDDVLIDIRARDERDAGATRRRWPRPTTPTCSTPASMDIDEAIAAAIALVEAIVIPPDRLRPC
jgi:cytidylate kinase